MAVVSYNQEKFLDVYPAIKTQYLDGKLTDAQLQYCFQLAGLFLDNTDSSRIPYDPEAGIETREILIFLLMCHIVTMALWPIGQSGPIASASQGSVSTSFQSPQGQGPEWFKLTPCGQTFWQAMRKYSIGGRYYSFHEYHPWG